MPELPEVETIKRDLEKHILNQRIDKILVQDPLVLSGINAQGKAARTVNQKEVLRVQGQKVLAFHRRGKYLIAQLGKTEGIVFHLRMTGQLLLQNAPNPKARLTLFFENAIVLNFCDTRRFGSAIYSKNWQMESGIVKLGAEPLDDEFNADYLKMRFKAKTASVHTLLLDQTIVAGIGNIYAAESLFYAGIKPNTSGGKISTHSLQKLCSAIKKVIAESIETRGHSMNDYVDAFGKRGSTQNFAAVYGRENQPCLTCTNPLKRIVLNSRSVVFCTICQR